MQPRHPLVAQAAALFRSGRNAEALPLLQQAADQGVAEALFILAELKWRGGIVPQDLAGAREFYRRAGEAGHAAATANFTNLLALGIAGHRDWGAALARLSREAEAQPQRRAMLALIEKMRLTRGGDPEGAPTGRRISDEPEVTFFEGLFSAEECDFVRQAAEARYEPSVVYDAEGRLQRDSIRTSDGSTFHWLIEDPAIHALNRRLAAASGTTAEQGEALQILRYRPGEQYRAHLDYVSGEANQRWLTALVYLNDDYEGGETCFLKTGLKVKGRKGDGIVFRNALPDGQPDPLAEHAGLPVTGGIKFLASRWIRERRWLP